MTNSEIDAAINEYIHSARDREIIHDRLVDGMTFGELEEKYNLCARQLSRIVRKADIFLVKKKSLDKGKKL